MTRIRVFIVLLVAIGLGGTFALATYRYIQNVPVREVSLPTTPVVVASANLGLGTELRREDLRVISWPADALPAGAFKDPQELVGRGLIQPMAQNEAVLPSKLAPVGAGAGLPPVIPEGKRALSVRVNDVIGVAGYVLPGNHVLPRSIQARSRPKSPRKSCSRTCWFSRPARGSSRTSSRTSRSR
jgi:pilus assembly protein CpaB